jgi:hypothetical protein
VSGYGIVPTSDKGVALSANLITTKQHMVLGALEPYKEATLIKVDPNGGVAGCINVSNQPQAAVEDQSAYLVMQKMDAGTGAMTLKINKIVKEKVTTIKDTARDICKYQKMVVTPICSYLTSNASATSSTGQPTAPPVAKSWALINYENTKEVAVEGEKNISIHEELLPVLKKVFGSQVKVKASEKSMWLTYIFPRLTTRADVEAVQKEYESLGYKITDSSGGDLWVSKVGRTLHMTFSIQNSMLGKLEVMF